jgi:hypothetical protein
MRIRRKPSFLVSGVIALGLLAGCVAIPTSGQVQLQEVDADPGDPQNIDLPEGPIAGQDMVEILQGFIRAGRGPQGNYQVAQEFLAPNTEWNGTSRVLVTTSPIAPVAVDADTLSITVTVVGEVDATGRYSTIPSQSQTLSYDFVEVDGEFRISRADPGTVLSGNGFANAFRSYPLYFFDPSFEFLVPDLRWFPFTRSAADRIVNELLAGPTPWLGSGVLISAFPQGTEGSADYAAPEVLVDLSADVRTESAVTQRRMIQQLEASLGTLGNVTQIEVTAGELSLAPAADDSSPESVYSVRDGAIGGFEGHFGTLTTDGVAPLSAIDTRADVLAPVAASLARDRTSVAVLGPAGVSLVGSSAEALLLDGRTGLVAPSLDPHGFTWSIPRNDPGGLIVFDSEGGAHPLPLAVDGQVVAIDVARDGARLLVALATPGGPRVMVVGIQRGADLVPVAFGAAFDLDVAGAVIDVAWVDGTHVAVLWSDDGTPRVDVFALGGPSESLGEIEGATSIVGGNLVAGIRVLASDGTVQRPSDAGGWRETGLVASFLGTQQ